MKDKRRNRRGSDETGVTNATSASGFSSMFDKDDSGSGSNSDDGTEASGTEVSDATSYRLVLLLLL